MARERALGGREFEHLGRIKCNLAIMTDLLGCLHRHLAKPMLSL